MSEQSSYITKAGYRRVWTGERLVMEHRLVWERENGPIPDGWVIHHINEDKLDNRIENLQCVDHKTHKRIHSGCELRDGVWFKPCSVCGQLKPVTDEHWYFVQRRGWGRYPSGSICRPCHITRVVERKSRKRAGRRTEMQMQRTAIAKAAAPMRESGMTWPAIAEKVGWNKTTSGLALLVKREVESGRV